MKLLAAPTRLYDWHLGWLLGNRFLRLTHAGRRSGRIYQTMLEVIDHDAESGELVVVAGLGRSAQWYRNIAAHPPVEVAIGRRRFAPVHRELAPAEAADVLAAYERRNRLIAPVVRLLLSRLVGWRYNGSPPARVALVHQLPMVAFRPSAHGSDARVVESFRSSSCCYSGLLRRPF